MRIWHFFLFKRKHKNNILAHQIFPHSQCLYSKEFHHTLLFAWFCPFKLFVMSLLIAFNCIFCWAILHLSKGCDNDLMVPESAYTLFFMNGGKPSAEGPEGKTDFVVGGRLNHWPRGADCRGKRRKQTGAAEILSSLSYQHFGEFSLVLCDSRRFQTSSLANHWCNLWNAIFIGAISHSLLREWSCPFNSK